MRLASTLAAACLALAATACSAKPAVRVLFVGNSYTYGNDLPGMVEQLADAQPVVSRSG